MRSLYPFMRGIVTLSLLFTGMLLLAVLINQTHIGRRLLGLSVLVLLVFLLTAGRTYRASEREGWTVRSRAHVIGAMQAALGLSLYLFLSFPVGEAYYDGTVTGSALGAIAVVSLYQLFAGLRYMNRWRTRDDIVRTLLQVNPRVSAATIGPYDWAFYGAVVIASRLLRLEFGDGTVLIITGFLAAFSAPLLVGLGIATFVRVHALFPDDAPLDA